MRPETLQRRRYLSAVLLSLRACNKTSSCTIMASGMLLLLGGLFLTRCGV